MVESGDFEPLHLTPSFHAARDLQARQGGSLVAGRASPHEPKRFWGRVVPLPPRTAARLIMEPAETCDNGLREVMVCRSNDLEFKLGEWKMKKKKKAAETNLFRLGMSARYTSMELVGERDFQSVLAKGFPWLLPRVLQRGLPKELLKELPSAKLQRER
eukprot:Skav217212  [mRNA]  locus=scaffold143:193516:194266:- [translate_table: standard]